MELRLESFCDEETSKPLEESFENKPENEKEKNTFRYFSREACILPLNEHTLKKKQDKEAEEAIKQKLLENVKKAEVEQKLKVLELNEKKKRQKQEEETKNKRQERRLQEELEEIDKLVILSEWKLCQAPCVFLLVHLQNSLLSRLR